MKYYCEYNRDALLTCDELHTQGNIGEQKCSPNSKSESACRDYSEEAIPERDPAPFAAHPSRNAAAVIVLPMSAKMKLH